MFHTGAGYLGRHGAPQIVQSLLAKGYLAVSFFFILSGFILAYTYEGKISGKKNAVHFWEARFARIYPVYVLSLVLMIPFAKDVTIGQKFTVLSMIQTWIPWRQGLIGVWTFPAWSLSVEAFFYLVFPLIFLVLNRMKIAGLRYLAALMLAVIVIGNLARPVETWSVSSLILMHHIPLPLLRLPEFIVGMALALIFLRSRRLQYSGLISVCTALVAIAVLCLPLGRWASIAIIPFAVLVASLAYQSGPLTRVLSTRILVLFGSASYAVYLLQSPIRIYTKLLVSRLAHAPHDLDAFLSPCFLLLVSVLVFLFWEEPARKFLRKSLGLRPRWKWPYLPATNPLSNADGIKSPNDR